MSYTAHINLSNLTQENIDYLQSCARIRRISCGRLIARIVKVVCEDQMVLAILDDESQSERQWPGEPTPSKFHALKEKHLV